jgi:hypothetical protein
MITGWSGQICDINDCHKMAPNVEDHVLSLPEEWKFIEWEKVPTEMRPQRWAKKLALCPECLSRIGVE